MRKQEKLKLGKGNERITKSDSKEHDLGDGA